MVLNKHQRAFGVFSNSADAQAALAELRAVDFPMQRVSVIAPSTENTQTTIRNKNQDKTNIGAIAGGTVGGAIGLTLGLGTAAAIPIVGPLALLGVAAATLATTLTSSVVGATVGGLVGALIDYGIPRQQATVYSDRIHRGDYFVMIEASEADIRQAEAILSRWHIQELRIYDVEPASTPIN